ncbi:MAG: hypothetical protein Q4D23_11015 [Bacteroidales bacterium]|nr:hypothetical protein [Bacteroidales bacterium]
MHYITGVPELKEICCVSCGGKEFINENGKRVCAYCNTAYVTSTATTTIAIRSDIEMLLAKCKADPRKAAKYANLILDIDPGNKEAHKYLQKGVGGRRRRK